MNSAAVFELDSLNAFVTVADCRSFTQAADRLSLTQSTISQQIKRLEERVGKTLFVRSTRSVNLTADGHLLIDYARSILTLANEAHTRMLDNTLTGHLTLAVCDDLACYWLPDVIRRYHQCTRNVRLEINVGITDQLLESGDRGCCDIILAKSLELNANSRIIGSSPLVWAGEPGLIRDPQQPVPLALFGEGCVYRRAAVNALNISGRRWETTVTSPGLSAIHAAVSAGVAIAPLAECFIPAELSKISTGLPTLPEVYFTLTIAKSSEGKPGVQRFMEMMAVSELTFPRDRRSHPARYSFQR